MPLKCKCSRKCAEPEVSEVSERLPQFMNTFILKIIYGKLEDINFEF